MWFSGESTPLPTHSQPDRSQESPLNPHRRLVRQTRFYHILHQVVPIYAHGCTVFMGGRSMNQSLDLGMMSTTGFQSPLDKPRTIGIHRTQFQTCHPKSLFFTLTWNNDWQGDNRIKVNIWLPKPRPDHAGLSSSTNPRT
jgi:hypothetical protein